MPRDEAILEANHTRLRPILMTTVMLVAAMVPIALGQGPGAACAGEHGQGDHRRPDALAVLALLVTPVAYSLWESLIAWWGGESRLRRLLPFSRRAAVTV